MKNLLLAVILLFDASDLRAVTRNSTITIGMSFSEAQILLQNYDAVELTIGISRPIGDIFPHYKLEHLGLVRGIIVRAPTISQSILGGLKNIIGGKIGAYTTMCEQTRAQAYEHMEQHAAELGANAIVGIRYDASSVEPKGAAVEVLCYGTAVKVTKKAEQGAAANP